MNLIDPLLQKQLPNNTLLMILFAIIQIIFIHMDWIAIIGNVSLLISLETFFSAMNFKWKEMRFLIPLNLLMTIVDVIVALFLMSLQEEHCSIASNYDECIVVSIVYGVFMLIGGIVLHGFSAVIAYYFYRLYPTSGPRAVDTHLFNEDDLQKQIETYDNMKRIQDLHLTSSNFSTSPHTVY